MAEEANVLRVRNAIFDAADGCSLDEAMQGIIMAQARIVAETVKGDETSARDVIKKYADMQAGALPIYCKSAQQ